MREMPRAAYGGRTAEISRPEFCDVLGVPPGSAQRRLQEGLRLMSLDRELEATIERRPERTVRSRQDQLPASRKTQRRGLRQMSPERQLQAAGAARAVRRLPQA